MGKVKILRKEEHEADIFGKWEHERARERQEDGGQRCTYKRFVIMSLQFDF